MIYLKILNGICWGILLSRWHDSSMMKIYRILRENRTYVRTYILTISDFPHISRNRWYIIEIETASVQASLFLGGMILLKAHISLTFRKVSGFLRYIKDCSKNTWFIYFVEFPYVCKLLCLVNLNEKRTQNHTIWKYYEKTRATVFSSLTASTDGLLKGVYCRGVSTDVGLWKSGLCRDLQLVVSINSMHTMSEIQLHRVRLLMSHRVHIPFPGRRGRAGGVQHHQLHAGHRGARGAAGAGGRAHAAPGAHAHRPRGPARAGGDAGV